MELAKCKDEPDNIKHCCTKSKFQIYKNDRINVLFLILIYAVLRGRGCGHSWCPRIFVKKLFFSSKKIAVVGSEWGKEKEKERKTFLPMFTPLNIKTLGT